jgi:ribose 5-phosphate isomerase A
VVIVSSDKLVDRVGPPIPLELLEFGLAATLRDLGEVGLRDAARSPDGGVIADFGGPVGDPSRLADRLAATPGVIEHGLFPPELTWCVLVGEGSGVRRIDVSPPREAGS